MSGLRGQSHAGEDLPALGEVPVAERRRGHARVRRPRAATQDAVLVAEEDLGVLRIRIRDEARIAAERAGGPLPHLARALEGPGGGVGRVGGCSRGWVGGLLVPGRRLLPLGFGGETSAVRAGEGVGLEPGDVAGGRLPGAPPPRRGGGGVVLLLPPPPLLP